MENNPASNEELQRLNKELTETKEQLEKSNHFKMHLLTLTSHQLKTPLGVIRGYAALLREGFYGEINARAKEILAKMEFAAGDLVTLVDNVIDLRKVEEGRIEYQMEHIDFVKVARQAADELGHMASSKGLNLSFEGPPGEIKVYADEQKLRHVIQNLVDNAVKYTAEGFVRVKVEEKDGNALLSVADSGIGIPPGISPMLFEEFVRDERVRQEIRGTGIGLSVAKTFVEAHKGKIWAESAGEEKGSIFYVSIPKDGAAV